MKILPRFLKPIKTLANKDYIHTFFAYSFFFLYVLY